MAHECFIISLMESLHIADKHIISDIMAHKGYWTPGTSAVNNSYKALNNLVDEGKLERVDNFYRLPTSKSNYEFHSKELTKNLASILKLNYQTTIFREHFIEDVGLRPDAMILIIDGNRAAILILEVMHNETQAYFEMKRNTWQNWTGACDYLSNLFGIEVESFNIINKAEEVI